MEALNPKTAKERAYTTYMTIMARLHKKGLLVRRREGKTDYYAPAYERDEYMALRAQTEVDDLVSQYRGRGAQRLRPADGKSSSRPTTGAPAPRAQVLSTAVALTHSD